MGKYLVPIVWLEEPVRVQVGDLFRLQMGDLEYPFLVAQDGVIDHAAIIGEHAVPLFEREG